jgi:hypothetical protein
MVKTTTFAAVAALAMAAAYAPSSYAEDLTSDQAYCRKLVNQWRMSGSHKGGDESLDLVVAIDQCRSGNPEPAIPVLEKRMREEGFTLPPRT